ncbi:MAG: D-alanyl-D-alanine carboxypeptidase/D-alanyl-D-alanine-endopeptidase, partial [Bacteroidetes bacterium]|nr:D-alanyl-D-alanine carboxypeptidase/D-alanyl-D-alanine-endopeptidase [Fibrella sp.]
INENLYRVFFRPGKSVGTPALVLRTEPPLPYLTFSNRVTTDAANTGDQVNIYTAPFSGQPDLTGQVPAGVREFMVKGALPNPAYTVAFALNDRLMRDSITVSNPPLAYHTGSLPVASPKRTKLLEAKSPTLAEVARQTNFQSINLYAEGLLRTTALSLDKTVRTFNESVKTIEQFWRSKGVDLDGFRPKDGSGLSTMGAVTAENMTDILVAMTKEKAFAPFYESIPVVGQSGTVRNVARNTPAAGVVRAKSGSIEGVRAYAGYFTAANGELMCFSVMVNKFTPGQTRAVVTQLEKILALLPGLQ